MKKLTEFEIAKAFNYNETLTEKAKTIIFNDGVKNSDELLNAIDNAFVYNYDIWQLLQYYYNPTDDNINFLDALDLFYNDLYKLLGF